MLLSLVLLCLIIVVPTLSYCSEMEGTLALALVGGSASLYLGLFNYWLHRDKMMQELFINFNRRYDEMNDDLLAISSGAEPTKVKERVVVDYLNLCAEEYFWFKRGRIDEDIWKAWLAGMNYWMKFPDIQAIAKKEAKYKSSYYGLFNILHVE